MKMTVPGVFGIFAEITGELQGLIRHRWHRWLFSGGGEHVIHHSHAHPYCAIAAGDFYQMVRQRILASDSVHLVTGCRVDAITRYENGGFVIQTERGTLRCRRVIDTRPPYPEYLVGMTDATARQIPEKLAGTPIFQVFLGYEVETERPCFDPTTAWLMTDMKSDGDGLRFVYMLPYTKTSALIDTRCSQRNSWYRCSSMTPVLRQCLSSAALVGIRWCEGRGRYCPWDC